MVQAPPVRILYMEDDAGLARLFRKNLQRAGFEVDLAPDGTQGLEMFREHPYTVLCVDHKMPGLSGLEVISHLVSSGELPPTIMITGEGDETVAVEAMKLGAADYVIKDMNGRYLELLPSIINRSLQKLYLQQEKQRAEIALAHSEQRFRSLFEDCPISLSEHDWSGVQLILHEIAGVVEEDPAAYVGNNPDLINQCIDAMRVLDANRICVDLFDAPSEEELLEGFPRAFYRAAPETAIQDFAAIAGNVMQLDREMRLQTFSGRMLHVAVRWSTVPEPRGTFSRVLVSLVDITARKRAEEELQKSRDALEDRVRERTRDLVRSNEQLRQEMAQREHAEQELRKSEERFRAIFDTAPDCIFVKDSSLRYTHVNPAMEKMFGMPASAMLGTTDYTLFDPETAKRLEDVERRVLGGRMIEHENTRNVKGTLTSFNDIRIPMRDSRNTIIGLCGISRNITDRKKTANRVYITAESESSSPVMKNTLAKARLCAETDSTVLLLGESGAGKDYLARYIHDRSKRAGGPFFSVNCAAVAPELAESELFGHEPGAFTGAVGRKRGLLELAEGGSLLLNEIGELPLRLQAKLLTFLDSRSFTRVGGEKNIPVSARLIAATNRDLDKETREGRFRTDLYYRLNVLSITVPPLRDRPEDLPGLVRKIVEQLAKEMQLPIMPAVDQTTMNALSRYHWPGNVRELRNVLERALILSGEGRIALPALGVGIRDRSEWSYTVTFPERESLMEVSDAVKRALVLEALNRARGSKQIAADLLGLSRFALFRLTKNLGVDVS